MKKANPLSCSKLILTLIVITSLGGCVALHQDAAPIESGSSSAVKPAPEIKSDHVKYNQASAVTTPAPVDAKVKQVVQAPKPLAAANSEESHVVQQGENLYRISLNHGLKYQDVAKWNNLTDYSVKVGQVLRLRAPTSDAKNLPLEKPVVDSSKKQPEQSVAVAHMENGLSWVWPTQGTIIHKFSSTNKGLDIAGKEGQPVVASASGLVAYSGSGLRGYGKLIIIKHNKELLSAYAHNKMLLVKEGDAVKKGQKIAEMGRSDASVTMLHFEIRRFGKPVDPEKYLK